MRRRRNERGSVTLWAVIITTAVLMIMGLVVDGGAQLRATQRADQVAREAARAAGQAVSGDPILGRPGLEAKTAKEFASWLEHTDSSQIRLADAGAGSASYLCGLFLQSLAGKSFTRVEFPGSAPALTALKENKVDMLCDQTPSVKAPLAAKAVQGYAQTTGTHMTTAPFSSLVTLRRMFSRELELSIWHGFYAPKGLPTEVQARLNAAIRQAAADPAFVADQQAQGVIMIGGRRLTPEGHKAFIEETVPLWQLIVSISKSRQK